MYWARNLKELPYGGTLKRMPAGLEDRVANAHAATSVTEACSIAAALEVTAAALARATAVW